MQNHDFTSDKQAPPYEQAALTAAQAGDRDEVLRLLNEVQIDESEPATRDELWLSAEKAYLEDRFADAVRLFGGFEHHPETPSAPAWQRYRSSQRRAFALLKLGRYRDAAEAVEEADERIQAHPDLTIHEPDVLALHAHLREQEGDFTAASELFQEAFENARRLGNWARCATTASDAGRVLGILGEPRSGLVWLRRARAALKKAPNTLVERTLELRFGILLAASGQIRAARTHLDSIIDEAGQDDRTPGLLADALARRADLSHASREFDDAEVDLLRALSIAEKHELVANLLYVHKDLAAVYLDRGPADDVTRAQAEFAAAISIALDARPPQLLALRQLAEDIVERPTLVGGRRQGLEELAEALQRLGDTSQQSIYQRATRRHRRDRAYARLIRVLDRLRSPVVHLGARTISPLRIGEAQFEVLKQLQEAGPDGCTLDDLIEKLASVGVTYEGVRKRLQRLGQHLGDVLQEKRRGREKVYYLRVPER